MSAENKEKAVERFCEQYAWLRVVFDEYRILYEKGQPRCDLLDEVARNFFRNLNRILVEYVLLQISKLTDPPRSGEDDNLTVKYILKLVSAEDRKELGLDDLSVNIHSIRPYIREARNKLIAHLDTSTVLSRKTVGEIPEGVLNSFWNSLKEFVDRVHKHYFGGILGDVVNLTNAEDLVEALKRAVHYKDYFCRNPELELAELQKMRYKDA
jgi:hypothetical protein